MAYLIELSLKCRTSACNRNAVVTVYDRWNDAVGKFCRPCGQREVKRRTASELINTPSGQPELPAKEPPPGGGAR
jgi:hypothetical protein